ncbi:hypothetical protein [Roseospira navarrensis]|uniref:Uncharacterized protein n=1 Tax=Roseospira navarrensis TaxID=140058 RepID=A0A7X2D684_9PROT|nr:hypothetical protein [Roseospira navarrensis]MQX38035.1 hypothetical protein [Roseospira navarrensis]
MGHGPDETHAAVMSAYMAVQNGQVSTDTIPFEAAVMVYRRLCPKVPESQARDRVAEIVAEGVSRAALRWSDDAEGPGPRPGPGPSDART